MAGNQYGFIYSFHEAIINLYSVVSSRIQHYMAMYNLTNDQIYYINLIFYQQDRKLLSEFALTKPSHISNCENSLTADILTVPISVNEDSIGKPLGVTVVNGFNTEINLIIRNNRINLMSTILNKAKILKNKHRGKKTKKLSSKSKANLNLSNLSFFL